MYHAATLLPALTASLRFAAPTNPNYPPLDTALTATGAGKRTVNEAHPLLTPEMLDDLAPRADLYQAAPYVTNMSIVAGQVVRYSGALWQATASAGSTLTPGVGVTGWQAFSPLSAVLRTTLESSARQVIDETLTRRKIGGVGGAIVQDVDLFSDPGGWASKSIPNQRFVGLQVVVRGERSIVVSLEAIGLQFSQAQENLPLYLYAADNPVPLAVLEGGRSDAVGFEWRPTTAGSAWRALAPGTYLLGYYEEDVTGSAIIRRKDLRAPCGSCNPANGKLHAKWGPFLSVSAIRVEAAGLLLNDDNTPGFLMSSLHEEADSNWGLNLRLSVRCDVTDFFVRHAAVLTESIQLQAAWNLLYQMAYSTRTNAEAESARQLAAVEIGKTGPASLRGRLEAVLTGLVFDTSGFDTRCLPCVPKPGGIRVGAV